MKITLLLLLVLVLGTSCATKQQTPAVHFPLPPLPVAPLPAPAVKAVLSPKAKDQAAALKLAAPAIQYPPSPSTNQWLVLTWSAYGSFASYTVQQRSDLGFGGSWQFCTNVTSRSATVPFSTTAPPRFYRVMATASPRQSVTLAWSPSADTNVIGYNIYYGVASRTYTNRMDVENVLWATVTNLIPGVTYFFAATAYNILGMESDYSNEAGYSVPGASSLGVMSLAVKPTPATVVSLPATNITASSAMLGGQVVDTGGGIPNTFFVYARYDSVATNRFGKTNVVWQAITYAGVSSNVVYQTVSNLEATTTYCYQFGGVNAAGIARSITNGVFTTLPALAAPAVKQAVRPGKFQEKIIPIKKSLKPVATNSIPPISFSVPTPPALYVN